MNNSYLQYPNTSNVTFVDILRKHAANQPGRVAYSFLRESESKGMSMTFAELDRKARGIAMFLADLKMQGQRALILLPSGLEYIRLFFGCLYAGVIAVPGFPPHFSRHGRNRMWLQTVIKDASPALAFATSEVIDKVSKWGEGDKTLSEPNWVDPETIDLSSADEWQPLGLTAETTAFLQYTSGSTWEPRAVIISHGNILHNQRVIQATCNSDDGSTVVGWLPFFHDMGLVGTVLHPAYIGARAVLMAPARFLQNPICWLRAISEHKGQSSSAPNFAYDLCCQKITEEQKKDLDLSSWRIAVNGAEPVQAETMRRFVAAFEKCGFRESAFLPSYGLAESTLMVTGSRGLDAPLTRKLSALALEHHAARAAEQGETARICVGCGGATLDQDLRIVDPLTLEPMAEGLIGEIWVSSPSVAKGYWNRPEETAHTFHAQIRSSQDGPFLRTGDLGFFSQQQLFVTGRLKDHIIVRGRNLYAQDIEMTAQNAHDSLRQGCGAAFAVELDGQERVVVVNELERHERVPSRDVIRAIQEAVALEHGIQLHAVVLVNRGTIPKTTSGKIRRSACRELFLADKLDKAAMRVWASPPPALSVKTPTTPITRYAVLQVSPEMREEFVQSHLQTYLATVLNITPQEIIPSRSLVSLGMDSLTALEVSHMLEAGLGVHIDIADLLRASSLSEVAAAAVELLSPQPEAASGSVDSGDKLPYHSLTPGQRGLWTLYQAAPRSVAYLLANAARVRGTLDVDALERAFRLLMARHEMLRAVFLQQEGEPVQRIIPAEAISLHCHLQHVNLSQADSTTLAQRLDEEMRRPFSLEKEPPIRLVVFHVGAQEQVLLLVLHHIIADLKSIDVILEELGTLYSAQNGQRPVQLAEMATPYLDFVRWQESNIHGSKAETLLNHWLDHLSGELPVLQLPADRPRPHTQSYRGAAETLHFSPDLYSQIKEVAREGGATPFMVLLGAFELLLHRISGQDEVLVGTPTSGRSKPEFSRVVGYCVNPVALRSRYNAQETFNSYLAKVKQTVLEAFAFQDCPFPLLVEKLHPQRDTSTTPIFQAFFVWQKPQGENGEALGSISAGQAGRPIVLGDLHLESIPLTTAGSQFDLTLMMTGGAMGLQGLLKYSTDLFDAPTIQRLGAQLSVLLEGIVAHPQRLVSAIPLLREAEREEIILGWNTPPLAADIANSCIHRLFEEQAQRHPERTALIVGEKELTYDELNKRSNQFARYLRALGVATEVRVGICLNRSIELIVAIFGIWKAGGAYVPFEPRDPKERLASLMERSGIHILITHEQLLDRLPEQLPHTVLLDLDLDLIGLEADVNMETEIPPQSLAYLIHTSGSTGKPKGAMIQHRSLMNLLCALREAIYDAHQKSALTVALNAPIAFDASVKQLLVLAMGHTLCLVVEDVRRNGAELLDYLQDTSVNVLDCTPTQLELLLEAGLVEKRCKLQLLLGGEPVPQHVWEILSDSEIPCYNVYGPTECTVDAMVCRIGSTPEPSIGRALPRVGVYLLDPYLEPTPNGAVGDIHIGGDSVGRGYVGQPDLTAERFIPDPFSAFSGARMYRAGDRARYASDGVLRFIGRSDRQIKLRGFRIELGEIEHALCQCPGVEDAAVTVQRNRHLIAYVVSSVERPANDYRRLLAQSIPEYMIPATVIAVPAIPCSANGKKDYAALPSPDFSIVQPGENCAFPQSAVEQYLVDLWSDVLQVEPIGIHDNFFALGGDSLQATKIVTRVQEKYQTDTPLLALFFQEPTVAALAQFVTFSCQPT